MPFSKKNSQSIIAAESGVSDAAARNSLRLLWMAYAVRGEHIGQRNNTQQFVSVRAADYGQNVDLIRPHALEGEVEPLIGVDMGKGEQIDEIRYFFVGPFRQGLLQLSLSGHADYSALIDNEPRSKFALAGA